MSQNPWSQFAKAVRKSAQNAQSSGARPPAGLFAGVGGLVVLGLGGLVAASSLFNGMHKLYQSPP